MSVGGGWQVAAFIDLPLARNRAGRLSYEILLGLSGGDSDAFTITDPLAYVANLARGASPADALAGPPRAPYRVRRQVRTRLRLLDVSPFALKYTLTGLDHVRLRPYVTAGPGRRRGRHGRACLTATPALDAVDAALSAGGRAPELDARGIPAAKRSMALGGHAGAGLEIRDLAWPLPEPRLPATRASTEPTTLQAASAVVGFHW